MDLAYWSTFVEVRRDAAAAFATLAMNGELSCCLVCLWKIIILLEANLEALSSAGTLGALLALIATNNRDNDAQVHRDAATALSHLVTLDDIKYRLVKAPDGINALFSLCRSMNNEVKRAGLSTISKLAESHDLKSAIVSNGGLAHLYALTSMKDEATRRQASKLLKMISCYTPIHEQFVSTKQVIRQTVTLLLDCQDLETRRDMIEIVTNVASTKERQNALADSGVLGPLLVHLDPVHSSLETIVLVIRCLYTLSSSTKVQQMMIAEGIVQRLGGIIFDELGEIREFQERRRANEVSAYKNIPVWKAKSNSKLPLEDEALRLGLSIFVHLSTHRSNTPKLLEADFLIKLLDKTIYKSRDKRVRRPVGKIINNLVERPKSNQESLHPNLFGRAMLSALTTFLTGEDYELKILAAHYISNVAVYTEAKKTLGKDEEILEHLVLLCNPVNSEINEWVSRALAELTEDKANFDILCGFGCIPALISVITPRVKNRKVSLEAIRALANLSCKEDLRDQIVSNGALGYLLSFSRSGTGLTKMYVLATLTNLEDDAAALRIQTVFRGFASRRKVGVGFGMGKRLSKLLPITHEKNEDTQSPEHALKPFQNTLEENHHQHEPTEKP